MRQYDLRDITPGTGDFQIDIPPGLPAVEETSSFEEPPVNMPLKVASTVASQVATEAAKTARNLLRRINLR